MSFRGDLLHFAQLLGSVAIAGPPDTLTPDDLDAALAARREVLAFLRRVLVDVATDGTPQRPVTTPLTAGFVRELSAQPVAVLIRHLLDYPAPRPQNAFGDERRPDPLSNYGRAWTRVGTWAQITHHRWDVDRPRPVEDQHWAAVADIAALAETLAVVDQDLLTAARRSPTVDRKLVTALVHTTFSGMRIAAVESAALAAAGTLPDWGEPTVTTPSSVMLVRTSSDLAPAQRRLADLVQQSRNLGPTAITTLAVGQARLLATVARAIYPSRPDDATRFADLARDLTSALPARRSLAPLLRDDRRPLDQTRELMARIEATSHHSEAEPSELAALSRAADGAPRVLLALADHAHAAVRDGRWLVLNTDAEQATDLLWRRASHQDRAPELCSNLAAVATRAIARGPTDPRPRAAASPRTVLAGVPALINRDRPAHPTRRPAAETRRRTR